MSPNDQASPESAGDLAWRGIEHGRQGEWTEALYWLSLAAESDTTEGEVPPVFYAYLGYGLARFKGNVREGVKLCQRAADLDLLQPEASRLLAETLLLGDERRAANDAIERGLEIDPEDASLLALKKDLGARRQPVLGFLPRHHAINRYLGWLRHRFLGPVTSRGL
ncbi:MAG: hypothetical protein AAFY88_12905 [Acidobacteriota bacterium]